MSIDQQRYEEMIMKPLLKEFCFTTRYSHFITQDGSRRRSQDKGRRQACEGNCTLFPYVTYLQSCFISLFLSAPSTVHRLYCMMNAGILECISKILMSPRTSCRQSTTFVCVNIYEPFDVKVCVCSCGCRVPPVHIWLKKSCTVFMAINLHLSYFNWRFLSKPEASPDAK